MKVPSTPSQDALNEHLNQIRAEMASQVKRHWEDQFNNRQPDKVVRSDNASSSS